MEILDIQIYLLRMANVLSIDIDESALEKMEKNRDRYAVEVVKGRAMRIKDRSMP